MTLIEIMDDINLESYHFVLITSMFEIIFALYVSYCKDKIQPLNTTSHKKCLRLP